jgi:transcriptional regulator with XRE-family HTH domain
MLALMVNTRKSQLAWITAILELRHWTPTALAREAGIDQSTLSRFINDRHNEKRLGTRTVELIAAVAPLPPYETATPPSQRGFVEDEAAPFSAGYADESIGQFVDAFKRGRNGVSVWTLNARALETAGYLPGDVLVVDVNAPPKEGDVVCAEVYDLRGKVETVFRLFVPPFIVPASLAHNMFKPMLIETERARVVGTVIASCRPRLSLLAS